MVSENSDHQNREPVSLNIFRLRSATAHYIQSIEAALPDIARLGDRGGHLLDLAEAATYETTWGSPASIGAAIKELNGS